MHIRSHLLGDKCSAGLCGSPCCPEDTMEELRIIVDHKAESLTKRKQEEKTDGGVIKASSKTNCENGTDNRLQMRGKEKMTAVEQVFIPKGLLFQARAVRLVNFFSVSPSASRPPGATTAPDLETFFEGFGVRGETIAKVKELGFTSKAFTSNLDELPAIIASIKQHSCHLTVGEEQGINCAAKHWQKGIIKMMAVEQKWKENMTAVGQGIKCTAKHWQKGKAPLSGDYALDLRFCPQVPHHNPLRGVPYPVHKLSNFKIALDWE